MTDLFKILVDTGDSSRQVDKLATSMLNLDRVFAGYAASAPKSLKQVEDAMARANKSESLFLKGRRTALDQLVTGDFDSTQAKLVESENKALKRLYDARLATAGKLSNEELQVWKDHGVSIGGFQENQLKELNTYHRRTKSEYQGIYNLLLKERHKFNSAELQTLKAQRVALKSIHTDDLAKEKTLRKEALASMLRDEKEANAARLADAKAVQAKLDKIPRYIAAKNKAEVARPDQATQAAFRARSAQGYADLVSQYATNGDTSAQKHMENLRSQAAATTNLTAANKSLSGSFKQLAVDGNDVHSMARGLASGFGALWLTWGNLVPLFIGAGISNGFMQTAKSGMAVAHTMEIIAQVGGNTRVEMSALNKELDRLATSGPFGPQQIADAMKTLSLAGLRANEILAVTNDVLNFSVAGTTSIETAASTLMSVSTAFGMGSAGFARVGDVISKAAAESMTSVESFSSAMKTASVINAQYGVSLEDTATAIAAMSQLGIEGTSAGTAIRNTYADLSGRSIQVAKVLRSQGIEMRDAVTGGFRPMIEVVAELNTKFQSLTAIGQKNLMQALLSERGAKGLIELLRLINSEAKDAGSGMANALLEMQSKIGDSAGFAAITAAKLGQTVDSQFKAVQATMQSTMNAAYREMEPTLALIARDLKAVFASEEFKSGLTSIVSLTAEFARVLVENSKVLATLALGYAGLKLAQMGVLAVTGTLAALTRTKTAAVVVDTVALETNSAAQIRNNAAKTGALASVAGLARALPYVGQALAVGVGAWLLWDTYMGNASRSAQQADDFYNNSVAKSLNDEANKIEAINKLMREGLTLREAQAHQRGQEVNEDTAKSVKDAQAVYEAAKKTSEKLKPSGDVLDPLGEARKAAARINALSKEEEARKSVTAAVRKHVDAQIDIEAAAKRVSDGSKERDAMLDAELKRAKERNKFGTLNFELGEQGGAKTGPRATLDEIIKREKEQRAALEATGVFTTEFDKINQELAKNLAGLSESYDNILKNYKDLEPAKRKALEDDKKIAEGLIKGNAELQTNNTLAKQQYEETLKRIEAANKEREASLELARARKEAAKESQRQIALTDDKTKFEESLKYELSTVQAAEKAKYEVRATYAEKQRQLRLDTDKRLLDMYHDDGTPKEGADLVGEMDSFNKAKDAMNKEAIAQEAKASAQVYKTEWDKVTGTIASNFTSKLMNGTLDVKEFMIETFANMVLQPQLQLMFQQGADALLGGAGGWFSTLMGMGSGGSTDLSQAAYAAISGFEGGGFTGTGPRSGGLDGKGGFMAMVHPNETVIDHTKGGGSQASSAPVYITITNTVGDVATKSMLDQANAATVKQIQAGMARSARYNGAMAR